MSVSRLYLPCTSRQVATLFSLMWYVWNSLKTLTPLTIYNENFKNSISFLDSYVWISPFFSCWNYCKTRLVSGSYVATLFSLMWYVWNSLKTLTPLTIYNENFKNSISFLDSYVWISPFFSCWNYCKTRLVSGSYVYMYMFFLTADFEKHSSLMWNVWNMDYFDNL